MQQGGIFREQMAVCQQCRKSPSFQGLKSTSQLGSQCSVNEGQTCGVPWVGKVKLSGNQKQKSRKCVLGMERSLDEVLGLYVLEDSLNKINIQRAKCRN